MCVHDLPICLGCQAPQLTPKMMSRVQGCVRNIIWLLSYAQNGSCSALLFHLEELISSGKYIKSYFCLQKVLIVAEETHKDFRSACVFCIKWVISGISINLPLLPCYCVCFCISLSHCPVCPRKTPPAIAFLQRQLKVCSAFCSVAAGIISAQSMGGRGSGLFPTYIVLCSSVSYILYSLMWHNSPFSSPLLSRQSPSLFSLGPASCMCRGRFSVICPLCKFLCFREGEAKRGKSTFKKNYFLFLCLLWWW